MLEPRLSTHGGSAWAVSRYVRVLIQYSVIRYRATSMADTNIYAIKEQKKAEYDRQHRLKRKLQMQQQASTSSATHIDKKSRAEYMKEYRLKHTLGMQLQASTSSETELARKRKKKNHNVTYNFYL